MSDDCCYSFFIRIVFVLNLYIDKMFLLLQIRLAVLAFQFLGSNLCLKLSKMIPAASTIPECSLISMDMIMGFIYGFLVVFEL